MFSGVKKALFRAKYVALRLAIGLCFTPSKLDWQKYRFLTKTTIILIFRSNIFLRSSPSSWSRNVYVERLVDPVYKDYAKLDNLLLKILYKDDLDREL